MKGKLLSSLYLIGLLVLSDLVFFEVNVHISSSKVFYIINFFISSLLWFLLFQTWIYKKLFNLKSGNFGIAFFVILPLLLSMHISERMININRLYLYSKTLKKKNNGVLWQPDDLLSHKCIPNASGSYGYNIGDSIKGSIPVIFDAHGFRTVPDSFKLKSDTTDLYLGCSYTFGDYIEAEKSYSYQTSRLLGHTYINAGASAYGYGQMLQLAEKLPKEHHFKYIFIQLSPWLVNRSVNLLSADYKGFRPFPYYSENGNSFQLNPPPFSATKPSAKDWRIGAPSYFEKIQFFFSDGGKQELLDYYAYRWAQLKVSLGMIPKPTQKTLELQKYFYDRVITIAKENNATPVVLKMGYEIVNPKELVTYLRQKVMVIDLDSMLKVKAAAAHVSYNQFKSIYHIHGHDSIIFDSHPNVMVNQLFSETIYENLKRK